MSKDVELVEALKRATAAEQRANRIKNALTAQVHRLEYDVQSARSTSLYYANRGDSYVWEISDLRSKLRGKDKLIEDLLHE